MKVRELVSQLQLSYLPDDEVIVAYWDKKTVEGYGAPKMSDEDWSCVIDRYDDGEWYWQGSAGDDFVQIAHEVMAEADKDKK
jgi:hypothetical protein